MAVIPDSTIIEYRASTWKIEKDTGFEYVFPHESTAWVIEPDGILREYRSLTWKEVRKYPTSKAWYTYRIWGREEQLNEYGFITVNLDALFRIPEEDVAGQIRFYKAGKFYFHFPMGDVFMSSFG